MSLLEGEPQPVTIFLVNHDDFKVRLGVFVGVRKPVAIEKGVDIGVLQRFFSSFANHARSRGPHRRGLPQSQVRPLLAFGLAR
jgi:hypothetical protein